MILLRSLGMFCLNMYENTAIIFPLRKCPSPPAPPFLTVKRFSNFGRESEAFGNFKREYKSDLRNIEWKLDGVEIECKGGAELCKRREAIRAQWLREWLIYAQKPLDMVDKIFARLIPNLANLAPALAWGKKIHQFWHQQYGFHILPLV